MGLRPKEFSRIDFNSAEASALAQRALREKKCLNDIYREIYGMIMTAKEKYLAKGNRILEIGSGGDFVKTLFPQVITSDVKPLASVDMVFSAECLPFEDGSLDAIISVFVLHHIPDVTKFLKEAYRCLKPGGGIICVETYYSPFARFIYKNFHPEPFNEKAPDWLVKSNGPMTGSNQALSYLMLERDKETFKKLFPGFRIVYRKPFGFLRYMLTGGLWLEQKAPDWMFTILKAVEILLAPLMRYIGLHHIFVIKKVAPSRK